MPLLHWDMSTAGQATAHPQPPKTSTWFARDGTLDRTCSLLARRPPMTTWMPRLWNASAKALPMPELPPVMYATFGLNVMLSLLHRGVSQQISPAAQCYGGLMDVARQPSCAHPFDLPHMS